MKGVIVKNPGGCEMHELMETGVPALQEGELLIEVDYVIL